MKNLNFVGRLAIVYKLTQYILYSLPFRRHRVLSNIIARLCIQNEFQHKLHILVTYMHRNFEKFSIKHSLHCGGHKGHWNGMFNHTVVSKYSPRFTEHVT